MAPSTLIKLAAALAFATGSAHASTELITNGSFEADLVANNDVVTVPNLTGWLGGASGIEVRNNIAGAAYQGSNFVELDTDANSSITQTIATFEGQKYTLSFAYSPRETVGIGSNGIDVYWNDEFVGTYSAKGAPHGNVWSTEVLELTGKAGNSVLTFKAGGASDSYGGSLDAVSLTSAVPEPETYGMMLLGLGLVGAVARRKANA